MAIASSDDDPLVEPTLSVVLVDPLPIVTEGLGMFLETQFGVDVIATANDADEALDLIEKKRGRTHLTVLVAMELGGDHDALWLMRALRERFPTILVLACGVNPTRMTVSRALFVGADGFINKRADPAEFIDGMRRAAGGEMVLVGLPSDWLGPIAEDVQREQAGQTVLSTREVSVLAMAARGLSAKGIAEELGVAERTITTHLSNIYDKLGVHSRVAAISTAQKEGLIPVDES
jgi:DNA-binding NarL/FixJ family response regulator